MPEGTYREQQRRISQGKYLYEGREQQRDVREAKKTMRQKTPEEMADIKGRTERAAARRKEEWRLRRQIG